MKYQSYINKLMILPFKLNKMIQQKKTYKTCLRNIKFNKKIYIKN